MPCRLVGVGELLWDELPTGTVPGGAPANFAVHAAQLGAEAAVISRIGNDDPGRTLLTELSARGVNTTGVETDSTFPTGRVTVEGEPPRYVIHQGVAWDHIAADTPGRTLVERADAVCFGTLARRAEPSRTNILQLLRATRPECLRVLDVNRREPFFDREVLLDSLAVAHVLKVNDEELTHLSGWLGLPAGERAALAELARRYQLKVAVCTRGERGSAILAGDTWSERPGQPVTVANTTGAGDSFTAALTLGLLAGWPLDVVHERAAAVAAFVCTRPGGMPPLPDHLRAPFLEA